MGKLPHLDYISDASWDIMDMVPGSFSLESEWIWFGIESTQSCENYWVATWLRSNESG